MFAFLLPKPVVSKSSDKSDDIDNGPSTVASRSKQLLIRRKKG